tara:strand:+ start:60 stop:980 length:921 start_codon:yes stop_codon:yes gene_type:complete
MNNAWIFPGQASQKVGMGKDLFEKTALGKQMFNQANDIMECDITSIIFNGPDKRLQQTQYTQPAIYIVSVIIGELLKNKGIRPSAVAGHSLGEYSALTIADVLDFKTGLLLVKTRSEEMAKAGKNTKGSMAAIIGLDNNLIKEICDQYDGDGIIVAANFNCPKQVVISGTINAVKSIMNSAKKSGARMTVELNVSGAFHSPLMASAREALAEKLNSIEISDSQIPVYVNVDAKPVKNSNEIISSLIRQLENPVLWLETITNLKKDGFSSFLEIGPGKVLQGLNKRIDRLLQTKSIGSIEQISNYNV